MNKNFDETAVLEMLKEWRRSAVGDGIDGRELKRLVLKTENILFAADLTKPAQAEACQHGIRWPHPCDICEVELKQRLSATQADMVRVPTTLFSEIISSIPARREQGSLYQRLNTLLAAIDAAIASEREG